VTLLFQEESGVPPSRVQARRFVRGCQVRTRDERAGIRNARGNAPGQPPGPDVPAHDAACFLRCDVSVKNRSSIGVDDFDQRHPVAHADAAAGAHLGAAPCTLDFPLHGPAHIPTAACDAAGADTNPENNGGTGSTGWSGRGNRGLLSLLFEKAVQGILDCSWGEMPERGVVNLHDRCQGAATETGDLCHGKHAVFGCVFTHGKPKDAADRFGDFRGAGHVAGGAVADFYQMLSHGFQAELIIESDDSRGLGGSDPSGCREMLQGGLRYVMKMALKSLEQGKDAVWSVAQLADDPIHKIVDVRRFGQQRAAGQGNRVRVVVFSGHGCGSGGLPVFFSETDAGAGPMQIRCFSPRA